MGRAAQVTAGVAPMENRLWPFSRRMALLAIPIVLLILALAVALMRATMNWPPTSSDSLVLTGILILSLIPLVLVVVDMIAMRGGALELPFVKLSFAASMTPVQAATIAANIGVPGVRILDSDSVKILDSMSKATSSDIVVIDLETGRAWWETRLLVLSAGAIRLGHPGVIVFVATEEETPRRFQGWARPDALLPLLLDAYPGYRQSYLDAQVAGAQWASVTPPPPNTPPMIPLGASPLAIQGANAAPFINGQPNPMAIEQFLAISLGQYEENPVRVTLTHLRGEYAAALHTEAIDRSWPPDRQTDAFLASDAPYMAITDSGRYLGLLPRMVGQTTLLRAILERERTATPPA
ncbi:MAG TPA: hypothetical protein VGX27_14035 [Candidatus Dormibacteraeota bacterium]|nr:hypothetical protein [Candidatus Dormibacteraeota bacterium]